MLLVERKYDCDVVRKGPRSKNSHRRVEEIELHNSRPHELVKFRGWVSESTVRREVLTGPKPLLGVSGGRKQP